MENSTVVTNKTKVCNIFNEYFVNIADSLGEPEKINLTEPLENVFKNYRDHPSIKLINENNGYNNDTFSFHSVTQGELYRCFQDIKPKKACGYDGQPPRLIKIAAPVLSYTLLPIINSCLTDSVFPQYWKYAEISPVFKKKDSLSKCNYRPVSVLSCQSKVVEKLILSQITEFINEKLSINLAAYRKQYSTQHVLVKDVEDWKLSMDQGKHTGCVLIDLSKAFDALIHGLLLAKLNAYGFSISACELLKSYTRNRFQRVKLGSYKSDWLETKRGVPQGSLLGPQMFNVFLNDIL